MEELAVKVPSGEELETVALGLSPGAAVGKRRVQHEDNSGEGQESDSSDPVDDWALAHADAGNTGRGVVKDLAESDDSEVKRREVVVQEELTLHEEEGEVVKRPTENGHANLVIEALERVLGVVAAATLPAQDGDGLEEDPGDDSS